MIQVRINKTSRKLSNEWQDVTIEQAIRITGLKIPEHITTVQQIVEPSNWVMSTEAIRYARDVFQILSGFDDETLNRANAYDLLSYFTTYLLPIVADLHSITPLSYVQTGIDHFDFNGIRYEMPKTLLIADEKMPLHSSKAVEFIESSNIMAVIAELGRDGIKHLPLFVATYCRPDGEQYDEKVIQQRAKEFNQLPMSVAWELFFCIQTLTLLFAQSTLNYTKKEMQKMIMRLKVQGWIASVTRLGFIRWLNRKSPVQLPMLNSFLFGILLIYWAI